MIHPKCSRRLLEARMPGGAVVGTLGGVAVGGGGHVSELAGMLRICIVAEPCSVRLVTPIMPAISDVIGVYVDWTATVIGWPRSTVPGRVMVTFEALRF